ncbi:hypothetical protein ACI3LY_005430 [Candidozyma auris]|nr:hypothetical protein CA7LBN_004006 [[Candida] auris]
MPQTQSSLHSTLHRESSLNPSLQQGQGSSGSSSFQQEQSSSVPSSLQPGQSSSVPSGLQQGPTFEPLQHAQPGLSTSLPNPNLPSIGQPGASSSPQGPPIGVHPSAHQNLSTPQVSNPSMSNPVYQSGSSGSSGSGGQGGQGGGQGFPVFSGPPFPHYAPESMYEPSPSHHPPYRPYDYYHSSQQPMVSSSISGPPSVYPSTGSSLAPMSMGPSSGSSASSFGHGHSYADISNPLSVGGMPPHGSSTMSYQPMPQQVVQSGQGGGGPPTQGYYRQSASFSGYPHASEPLGGSGAGKNRCPVCHKVFKRPSSLQIHYYIHTGVKMFKCEWEGCGRMFNVKSNMKRHYRLHLKKEEQKRLR